MQEVAKVLGFTLGECQVGTRGQGVKQEKTEEQGGPKYKSEKKKRKTKQEEKKNHDKEEEHDEEEMKDGEEMQDEQVDLEMVKVEKSAGTVVFSCEECGKQYEYEGQLKRHKISHKSGLANLSTTEGEVFTCSLCAEKFKSSKTLGKHLLRTHGEGFTCSQCSEQFETSVGLAKHLSKTHGIEDLAKPKLLCTDCDKTFSLAWKLTKHKQEKHEEGVLGTAEEPENPAISEPKVLETEKITFFPETYQPETYYCKKCPVTFPSKQERSLHNKNAHSEALIPCDECDSKFTRKDKLTSHKKVVHKGTFSGGRPIRCFICDEAFTMLDELKKHILTHDKMSV